MRPAAAAAGVVERDGEAGSVHVGGVDPDEHRPVAAREPALPAHDRDRATRSAAHVRRDRAEEHLLGPVPIGHADHQQACVLRSNEQGRNGCVVGVRGGDRQVGLGQRGGREHAVQDVLDAGRARCRACTGMQDVQCDAAESGFGRCPGDRAQGVPGAVDPDNHPVRVGRGVDVHRCSLVLDLSRVLPSTPAGQGLRTPATESKVSRR